MADKKRPNIQPSPKALDIDTIGAAVRSDDIDTIGTVVTSGDFIGRDTIIHTTYLSSNSEIRKNKLIFSPDMNCLGALSDNGVYIWNSHTGKLLRSAQRRYSDFSFFAWSPKSNVLVLRKNTDEIEFWDIKSGKFSETYPPIPKWNQETLGVYKSGEFLSGAVYEFVGRDKLIINTSIKSKPNLQFADLAWSKTQDIVASVRYQNIELFEVISGAKVHTLNGHTDRINCLIWSPDGAMLASGSDDSSIKIWRAQSRDLYRTLTGHSLWVTDLNWSPDGKSLISCGGDNTIRVWDIQSGWQLNTLEGHTDTVIRGVYSSDGRLVLSQSMDNTLRIWRTDTWETIANLELPDSNETTWGFKDGIISLASSKLNSTHKMRITRDQEDLDVFQDVVTLEQADKNAPTLTIRRLDLSKLQTSLPKSYLVNYVNAKIVLVGDSGVGKSGLGLVLTGKSFQATDSTHGRNVWTFEKKNVEVDKDHIQTRETLLWDLAGQPGYRLIHQLHLDEVNVALVVFDSRSETDPFAGVRYWNRALRQSQLILGNTEARLKKYLVAARADRGGVGVSKERLSSLIAELSFDGYYETSAKENWGIPELRNTIRAAIEWQSLPNVVSSELFQFIRAFLLEEKKTGRLLSTHEDLYRTFLKSSTNHADNQELRKQFVTVIVRIESNGLIRQLSFGSFILLQPELLDAYASFIVNAARDEPEGLGSILEELVLTGRFRMPETERIKDRDQEKLLLISAVEDMLRHEIIIRENSEDGTYLVFPSQFTRERPDLPDPQGKAVVFQFEGSIMSIYTTLAVRLSHSGVFSRKETWKSASVYCFKDQGEYGIFLRELEEGKGELVVFYGVNSDNSLRALFEEFIHTHLKRRALPGTIVQKKIVACAICGFVVTEQLLRLRTERGFNWVGCPVCNNEISFVERPQEKREIEARQETLGKMDEIANTHRAVEANVAILEGKKTTDDFDVFISYSQEDGAWVKDWLLPRLEQHGIYVFQEKNFELGKPLIENIEIALNRCPRTLLILTPTWVANKWKTFDSLLLQTEDPANVQRRMIPILLQPCDIPKRIALLARADLSKPEERDSELIRVITAIASHD